MTIDPSSSKIIIAQAIRSPLVVITDQHKMLALSFPASHSLDGLSSIIDETFPRIPSQSWLKNKSMPHPRVSLTACISVNNTLEETEGQTISEYIEKYSLCFDSKRLRYDGIALRNLYST